MNILITRPNPHGKDLVNKLLNVGKFAYHLPLIYFSPGRCLPLLKKKLNSLSKGDFLIIASQHAARYAHSQLLKTKMNWPSIIKYYSIGQKTSLIMHKLSGISSKYPCKESNSENLLQFPELISNISGHRVLILKGNNGRELLKNTLQKRGAIVLYCECYIRKPFQYNGIEQCKKMLKLNIKIIIITTSETLKQLYYLIPQYYRINWLIKCKLIVISKRLATIAKKFGWKNIIITKSANNSSILKVLMQHT